jgi:DNA-binding NarL/FixJ family response regulator
MIEATAQVSIFLVIPDQAKRAAIQSELSQHFIDSEFESLVDMLKVAEAQPPQLIVCHQTLFESEPSLNLAELCQRCSHSRVMVIGPSRPISIQIEALKDGARGYFNEDLPLDKFDEALQLILHGEVWVERYVISGLIDELTHKPTISDEQKQALETLSSKEGEVAKLVSHGATNKMIARQLSITERTVKAHLTSIFNKMGLKDRLSLAIFFRDLR